jgi:hypothetical protein
MASPSSLNFYEAITLHYHIISSALETTTSRPINGSLLFLDALSVAEMDPTSAAASVAVSLVDANG